jgi:hypothetical protein
MINLRKEESLRIQPGAAVQVACLAGVLWITQAGDRYDRFVAAGERLPVAPRGLTVVTALEPAMLCVEDLAGNAKARSWWRSLARPRASSPASLVLRR